MKENHKKVVKTFAFAAFLNDLGAYLIFPMWPIFVTTVMGANMTILGLIDGLGDAFVSISQAVSGYISDRIKKRKIFIWTGYVLGAFSRIGYAISTTWGWLIPFRIIDRGGKIRDAPRDAIVADFSTRHNRGKNFGFIRAMDKAGAVCGIILSILLIGILGFKKMFLLASIPSIIGAALIIFLIKERRRKQIKLYKGITFKQISGNLRLFIILSSIFALGSFSYSFLLIYAKQFGFQITTIPILFLVFTAVASLMSIPFGKLSDRIGRKTVLMISYTFWALLCLTFLFVKSYTAIIFAFILYGLHMGSLDPVQKTFVSELAPKKFRASVLGGFEMVVGLVALPASLTAGFLWDTIGLTIPFAFSLGLTVIAMIMLMFVKDS
jgi:MFS family permease